MKIFLTSAYPLNPVDNFTPSYLSESFISDPFKRHQLVNGPESADIIIFAEHHPGSDPYFFDVLKNEIYKKHKQKCYLYHDNDQSLTLLPTISPSIEAKYYNSHFHQSFPYIVQLSPNHIIRESKPIAVKNYLFSFVGATRTNIERKRLFDIRDEKGFLLDTSEKNSWELSDHERAEYYTFYRDICFQSKFILCPRGIGPSSYRLYESMEMGIAPVIIADEWMPFQGPDWDTFSIRIKERDTQNIPHILEKLEPRAEEMGLLARRAWEAWVAKDKQFHYLAEAALKLHNKRDQLTSGIYFMQYLQFLRPYNFRGLLRYFKNKIKRRLK